MIADGLTAWLADHPEAAEVAPELVALARGLAEALADAGAKDVAALSRELRLTMATLRELGASTDGEADLAAELSTAVGDRAES